FDKTACGLMIERVVLAVRCKRFGVQTERRLYAGYRGAALMQLYANLSGDSRRAAGVEGVERIAQRRHPQSVVHELGVLLIALRFEAQLVAREGDALESFTGGDEQDGTGTLIDFARF